MIFKTRKTFNSSITLFPKQIHFGYLSGVFMIDIMYFLMLGETKHVHQVFMLTITFIFNLITLYMAHITLNMWVHIFFHHLLAVSITIVVSDSNVIVYNFKFEVIVYNVCYECEMVFLICTYILAAYQSSLPILSRFQYCVCICYAYFFLYRIFMLQTISEELVINLK